MVYAPFFYVGHVLELIPKSVSCVQGITGPLDGLEVDDFAGLVSDQTVAGCRRGESGSDHFAVVFPGAPTQGVFRGRSRWSWS